MKKTNILLCLLAVILCFVGCTPDNPQPPIDETIKKHLIVDTAGNYGGTLDEAKYGVGAPHNGEYDKKDSIYYSVNDFYNMKSTKDRTIFTGFAPYQQTMKDSGGIACALMVLNHCGEDVKSTYSEVELVKKYEAINNATIFNNGATAMGLEKLFSNIGYTAVANAYSPLGSTTVDLIDNFRVWTQDLLNGGNFIMVRYQDGMEFNWHVIIGIDTMGTEFVKDDVLIMADPFDNLDHFQDGYSTSAAGRFYRWWQNVQVSGKVTDKLDCVVVTPKKPIKIERVVESKVSRTAPDKHLVLNADGSYGGTLDEEKYGLGVEKNGSADHTDANYYNFLDYYNMGNTESAFLLTSFAPYQQTMASSCGVCSTMMVLNYYGLDATQCNEVFLTDEYCRANNISTIKNKGVGSSGLKKLVATLGYDSESRSYSKSDNFDRNTMLFPTYESFSTWVKGNITKRTPMPVSWKPQNGHWEVIIGIDTMGTDYIYDDVIVLADSADTWDHYQDGYNTIPATMFYGQWYNSTYSSNQQYNIFDKKVA